jgi:cysteine sulfinate desulfinase/cysteine desulfurase-like protein
MKPGKASRQCVRLSLGAGLKNSEVEDVLTHLRQITTSLRGTHETPCGQPH